MPSFCPPSGSTEPDCVCSLTSRGQRWESVCSCLGGTGGPMLRRGPGRACARGQLDCCRGLFLSRVARGLPKMALGSFFSQGGPCLREHPGTMGSSPLPGVRNDDRCLPVLAKWSSFPQSTSPNPHHHRLHRLRSGREPSTHGTWLPRTCQAAPPAGLGKPRRPAVPRQTGTHSARHMRDTPALSSQDGISFSG